MVDALVEKLQKANWAYRNTDTLLMSDEEYDRDLEKLRALSPAHPFLSLIGAKPPSGVKEVILPVTMGSLDKVIYGEGGLDRWKKRMGRGAIKSFVITEKLDGISAMFVIRGSKKHLYLRGDGVRGVDVSLIIGTIGLGSVGGEVMVRGEIVLPVAATPPGSIGRSLINGWVHRSSAAGDAKRLEVAKELSAAHFVGYQVLEPAGMTRRQQSEWLSANGFRKPWTRVIAEPGLKEDALRDMLVTRRAESEYPLDGIVIGADCVPAAIGGGEAKNPADCIAFKAALDEQKETTTVIQVEWNASRQGCLIPRIQVEPVTIGGANIQWLSGHNAAMIYKNKIGPGARIVVRRSGDVIPTLDSVVAANEASMPSVKWAWDSGNTHAMASASEATNTVPMLHALQTLGVENIGPGLVDKLAEAGLTRMRQLWDATPGRLSEAIGAGRGPALHKNLRECVAKAGQLKLLIASNLLPRGVGERKLRLLYAKEADARRWRQEDMADVAGWSAETLSELFKTLPAALAWPSEQFGVGASFGASATSLLPASASSLLPASASSLLPAPVTAPSKFVVFTGVRDKVLEENIRPHGWAVEPAVTKKTTVLVIADVADADSAESGKVKKARAAGIRIMRISDFRTFATV
jgi:NAD-dependent DNA ligase